MLGLVSDFVAQIEADTSGAPGREAFIQKVNSAYRSYKEDVWATAPKFTPFTIAQIKHDVESVKKLNVDFSGEVEEIKEEGRGEGGKHAKLMNVDDVRKHIEMYVERVLHAGIIGNVQVGHSRAAQQRPISRQGSAHTTFHLRLE